MEAVELDRLAAKYGTDKRSGKHGYTRYYERHLRGLQVSKLLEIGVYQGASLLMWADYLPLAQIDGIDCVPLPEIAHKMVRIHRVDASNRAQLGIFAERHGPWDVIVDDGSHFTSHQVASFEVLWPYVRKGGFYVVEDAFCTFLPQFSDYSQSLFAYFGAFLEQHFRGRWYSDESRTDVTWVEFSTGLIVIGKAR